MAYVNENGEVVFGRAPSDKKQQGRRKPSSTALEMWEKVEIEQISQAIKETENGHELRKPDGSSFLTPRHIGADRRVRELRKLGFTVTPIYDSNFEKGWKYQKTLVAHVTWRDATYLEEAHRLTSDKLANIDKDFMFALAQVSESNTLDEVISEDMLTDFNSSFEDLYFHIGTHHKHLTKAHRGKPVELMLNYILHFDAALAAKITPH